MSLAASKAQLATLTKDLSAHWAETRNQWRDHKSQEFDVKYLQALETNLTTALAAIEKLETVLAKVRNDCD